MPDDNRGERLASLESEVRFIKELVVGINLKLDTFQQNYVTKADLEDKLEVLDKRVGKIEDNLTWIWRALFSGMISWVIAITIFLANYYSGGN